MISTFSEKHHHPHEDLPDIHHLLGQPARSTHPGLRGRASHDQGQQPPRKVRALRHPARTPWCPSNRGNFTRLTRITASFSGHLRHRRQRNPERQCRRQVHRKVEQDHHHQRQGPSEQGGDREDGQRGREVQGRRRDPEGPHPGQELPRELRLQHEADPRRREGNPGHRRRA